MDQKDGRCGRYAVHEEGDAPVVVVVVVVIVLIGVVGSVAVGAVETIGRELSDGVAVRTCCSQTSRAL